jgi:hypothetical protein
MLCMTSKLVSRVMNEANVYFVLQVVIWIALGMTKAVIFFSMLMISVKTMVTWVTGQKNGKKYGEYATNISDPTKDVGVKA